MEDQTLMDNSFGDMRITDRMKSMIAEIAKWAKLLSIIGFIGIGLMVIAGLFAGSMLASMSSMGGGPAIGGGFFTVIYLLVAALYFFPVLYLYQFATGAQKALASGSDSDIEMAFESLRKHYRFLGILMIVILSIYALMFVIGLIGMAAM
jgi:hypothetical protein